MTKAIIEAVNGVFDVAPGIEQAKRQVSYGAVVAAGGVALLSFNAMPVQAREHSPHYRDIEAVKHQLDRRIARGDNDIPINVHQNAFTTSTTKVRRTRLPIEALVKHEKYDFGVRVKKIGQECVAHTFALPRARTKLVFHANLEAPIFNYNPNQNNADGGMSAPEALTGDRGRIVPAPDCSTSTHQFANFIIPVTSETYQMLQKVGHTVTVLDISTPERRG